MMGRPALNLIGRRFGRLTVVAQAPTLKYSRWRCVCDCGATKVVNSNSLNYGDVRSCGCLRREQQSANLRRLHALHLAGRQSRPYRAAAAAARDNGTALASVLGYTLKKV